MTKVSSTEFAQVGLSSQATDAAIAVWVVAQDGGIDGPGTEPFVAAAVVELARQAASSGMAQTRKLVAVPKSRAVKMLATPRASGDVIVAAVWLDELGESESALSRCDLVLRVTRDAVWDWNPATKEVWWSRRQYEMLGYDPETTQPSYEAWASKIHPEDRERVTRDLEQAVAKGATTWRDEFRFQREDGSIGMALDRGYIERDGQGRAIRMIGVMSDVTAERTVTTALATSEERFRQLASAIDEVFWLSDASGRKVIYISPAYETIWGRSCQSVYDNPDSFLEAVLEEDRPEVQARLAGGDMQHFDVVYRIRRPNGTLAWIRARTFPIHDASGTVVRIAGVASDITAQRALEERLLQTQKLESIGRLAGGVAHDFNNLLTVILASTDFAMRNLPPADASLALLEEVRDAAERAARLTSQLLSFARRQHVVPQLLEINLLIEQMGSLLRRLIGQRVKLTTHLGDELRPVLADPGQIEQVIVNLVVNACDAMPGGGSLRIETANISFRQASATAQATLEAGDYVVLSVSDTGTGISADVLDHIFEPFFTTKRPGHGTGLGLATCYGTIQQAGGQILVESELGKGTTFKILLPQATGAVNRDESKPPTKTTRGHETILVAEDDPTVRTVAVRILRDEGYQVLEASSGAAALHVAATHEGPIHLLLTDIVMPEMSGTELARQLLRMRSEIRVLCTSGFPRDTLTHDEDHEALLPLLAKPYIASTLLAKVREVLDAPARPHHPA